MSACRSCRAPILWVVVESSGRRMPLDRQPSDDGWVRLLDSYTPDGTQAVEVLRAYQAHVARRAGETLHTSHFATCPDADDWRVGRG